MYVPISFCKLVNHILAEVKILWNFPFEVFHNFFIGKVISIRKLSWILANWTQSCCLEFPSCWAMKSMRYKPLDDSSFEPHFIRFSYLKNKLYQYIINYIEDCSFIAFGMYWLSCSCLKMVHNALQLWDQNSIYNNKMHSTNKFPSLSKFPDYLSKKGCSQGIGINLSISPYWLSILVASISV